MNRFFLALVVSLLGFSAEAQISVRPSSVDFGTVMTGGYSQRRTVYISNDGNKRVNLRIDDYTCSPEFRIDDFGCFGSLNPRQFCSITVEARGMRPGFRSCQTMIRSEYGTTFLRMSAWFRR